MSEKEKDKKAKGDAQKGGAQAKGTLTKDVGEAAGFRCGAWHRSAGQQGMDLGAELARGEIAGFILFDLEIALFAHAPVEAQISPQIIFARAGGEG